MTLEEQVVKSVKCPCGAQENEPCVTTQGNPREPHLNRMRRYREMVAFWSGLS